MLTIVVLGVQSTAIFNVPEDASNSHRTSIYNFNINPGLQHEESSQNGGL